MVVSEFVIMNLIANKGKSLTECHNEILDIVYNVLLNDTLINFFIAHTYFLYVDKVKKVFVFEHLHGMECLFVVRKLLGSSS